MGKLSKKSSSGAWEPRETKRARRVLMRVLQALKIKGEAQIFFLAGSELRRIKRRFYPERAVPRFVDVLAFPEPRGFPHPGAKRFLGEIYLNKDLVLGAREKLDRLIIHGVLHLLGYDHEEKRDRIKMEHLEERLYRNKRILS